MTNSPNQSTQGRRPEQDEPSISKREGASSTLSNAALAEQCRQELRAYRRGEPCEEAYGLELFRRATVEGDIEAWELVQCCFEEVVLDWYRRHPNRAVVCRLESEENYVALAFEHFLQAAPPIQQVAFRTLAAALQCLRASLHGAILDRLRVYLRLKAVSLPKSGVPGGPCAEDQVDSGEVWEILQVMLPNQREQRLAYLLFHCGLKPREIVRFCPQEWSNVQEIYHLRRNILERLMRNTDQLGGGSAKRDVREPHDR